MKFSILSLPEVKRECGNVCGGEWGGGGGRIALLGLG